MEASGLVTTSAAAATPAVATSLLPAAADQPTDVDDLTEYRGRSLPGAVAVLTCALAVAGALGAVWWTGELPRRVAGFTVLPSPPVPATGDRAVGLWGTVMLLAALAVVCAVGLTRGRPGAVLLLTRYGAYRGTVSRTGLLWINPLLGRRRVDVRLRHFRSHPLDAVDADGVRLRVTVRVVWRTRDTARASFMVDDPVRYLRDQVESAVALVMSRLPADDLRGHGRTLRDIEHVGTALTRVLAQDTLPVGIEVISARPARVEYAPAIADAMRRRQLAVLDARYRQAALDDVVDAVSDMVDRLADRGLADLTDEERKTLVKDLTVAFCTTRVARRG